MTSSLTLHANILRTRNDIEKRSTAGLSYFVRFYICDQHVFWVNFPFSSIHLKFQVQLCLGGFDVSKVKNGPLITEIFCLWILYS